MTMDVTRIINKAGHTMAIHTQSTSTDDFKQKYGTWSEAGTTTVYRTRKLQISEGMVPAEFGEVEIKGPLFYFKADVVSLVVEGNRIVDGAETFEIKNVIPHKDGGILVFIVAQAEKVN